MKRILALILVLLMLSSCGVQEEAEEPPAENSVSEGELPEEPEYELGEGSRILENCVFKTAEEKYGIQKDGKIVFEAEYDVFKFVGKIGEKNVYALGKRAGTMPTIIYDDDARVSGIGEREKVLYDFFFEDGSLILSVPADSYSLERSRGNKPGTKFWLYTSLEGNHSFYEFNKDGEIVSTGYTPAGKTGDTIDDYVAGYEKVCYYYGPTDMEMGLGLVDSSGNEIVPAIYSDIYLPFEGRIVALRREGGFIGGTCRILDAKGNIICDKYHSIDFDELPDGRFIGIAFCPFTQSQPATVCRDENGEVMEGGYRFIDKDGNELSEVFIDERSDFYFRSGGITAGETTINILSKDYEYIETDLYDYAFIP